MLRGEAVSCGGCLNKGLVPKVLVDLRHHLILGMGKWGQHSSHACNLCYSVSRCLWSSHPQVVKLHNRSDFLRSILCVYLPSILSSDWCWLFRVSGKGLSPSPVSFLAEDAGVAARDFGMESRFSTTELQVLLCMHPCPLGHRASIPASKESLGAGEDLF
ncbi:Hypothetical predicted protein [Podarcis lilfordi]|uniref:Uncharacterized protein n=1 Tax=Podarcis lilfordi TaxID=74358 RepID=A0AA35NZU4_9SAUR|nr:Hypothetical predicted protein [Podarcis lilfordi]